MVQTYRGSKPTPMAASDSERPFTVALAGGGFAMVWYTGSSSVDGSDGAVQARVFSSSGEPLAGEFLVNTTTRYGQSGPTAAPLENGGFVVTWVDSSTVYEPNGSEIRGQIFAADGSKVGGEFLANSFTQGFQSAPDVTALAGGGFLVTYRTENWLIRAQRFAEDGSKVGPDFAVNSNQQFTRGEPAAVGLDNGGFLIVWEDYTPAAALRGQLFDSSGTMIGGEIGFTGRPIINDFLGPRLVRLADGNIVTVWSDGSKTYGQMFDANGVKTGGEAVLRLGKFTDVAAAPDGGFLLYTVFAYTGNLTEFDANGNKLSDREFDTIANEFEVLSNGNLIFAIPTSVAGPKGKDIQVWVPQGDGTAADDTFLGTSGDDVLSGVAGDDYFFLRQGGSDRVSGGDGSDTFQFYEGFNTLDIVDGGSGIDTVILSGVHDIVSLRNIEVLELHSGRYKVDDSLFSSVSSVKIRIAQDAVVFDGSAVTAGAFVITGGPGVDTLIGGGGNDVFYGSGDTLRGGGGDDTYYSDPYDRKIEESAGGGLDTIRVSSVGFNVNNVLAANVERLVVESAFGSGLNGNSGDNALVGGAGADRFYLQQGGEDEAFGNAGIDGYYFGGALSAGDVVHGQAGEQVAIQGNYAGFTLGSGNLQGVDTLVILAGNDARFGVSPTNFFSYNLTTVDANVAAGLQLTVNSNGLRASESLVFDGSAETNGSFRFFAGLGSDRLTGGSASDGFFFQQGALTQADRIDGGGGVDDQVAMHGAPDDYFYFTPTTITNVETLVLLSQSDTRFGGSGVNYVYRLVFSDGNVAAGAQLTVNAGGLTLNEQAVLDGAYETSGRFRFIGGAGSDSFIGGAGDDLFFGGRNADYHLGNGGADTFVYTNADQSTVATPDSIFQLQAVDRIDLSSIDARPDEAGDQAFSFIGAGAFSGKAGELRLFQNGTDWRLEADVNGDGVADLAVNLVQLLGYVPVADNLLL